MIEKRRDDWMPFYSIATFIVAIAFLLTCIYIAKLILNISGLLTTISQSFDHVERQLDGTILETERLIVGIEQTATDVEGKLSATSGAFRSLENVGEATSHVSRTLKEKAKLFERDQEIPGIKPFIRSIQWREYASVLVRSWERGKSVVFEKKSTK